MDASIANPSNYDFLWTPSTYLSANNILNPVTTPLADIVYAIRAMDKTSFCIATDTMKVTVVNQLKVPNAFSPNGDGINDKWVIDGLELYPNAIVSLYTRGGLKIAELRNYKNNPWDGIHNGKPVPVGTYAYIIQFYPNKKDAVAGMLLVIR